MNTQLQNTIIDFLSPYAGKIAVFGSYARGEENKDSDIDLMIDLKVRMGLFGFAGLQEHLSDKLGIKVDLLTFNTIKNKRLLGYIEKDLKIIYN
ncbi:MAG: nucleotidyltransferase family protein [Bacteroidetes bacterium]|nr:nucleotidyltransferase family protein [Bacteroidota bacterium]